MQAAFLAWMLMLACCAADGIPVLGFDGAALSDSDFGHILDLSQKLTGPRAKVWFISAEKVGELTDDQGRFARNIITLTVYLEPTTKSPRLRRGELIVLHNGEATPTPRIQRAGRWIFDPDARENIGSTYACVPREPGRFLNTPGHLVDLREGPFEIQHDPPLSDAEVIAINTAVRRFFIDKEPSSDSAGIRGIAVQNPLTSVNDGCKSALDLHRLSPSPNDSCVGFAREGCVDFILFKKTDNRWQPFSTGEVDY